MVHSSSSFQPKWVSIPGDTILDILNEKNLSISLFADQMNSSVDGINKLLSGISPITKETSRKLEQVLGVSNDFWLSRENQYREGLEKLRRKEESWLKMLPLQDMIKFGWLKNDVSNKVEACLKYFEVPNIDAWHSKFETDILGVSFRTSSAVRSQPGAIATWIHQGIKQSNLIKCKKWNPSLFQDTLQKIKPLTRIKDPNEFIPKLVDLCSQCGVAIAIVRTPTGCPASGLTKFLTPQRALLMLSFRYLTDDQFWFTFFHEAGHLLLHGNKEVFVEEIGKDKINNQMEDEANNFAAEQLIPDELRSKLIKVAAGNKRSIIGFASLAGISPGIVIGQLQHMGKIDYSRFNSYKRRYTWEENTLISNH